MFQPGQKKPFVAADVVAQRDEQAEDRVLCQNCSKFFKARKNVLRSLGEPLNSWVWAFTTWKQEVDLKKIINTYFPIPKKKKKSYWKCVVWDIFFHIQGGFLCVWRQTKLHSMRLKGRTLIYTCPRSILESLVRNLSLPNPWNSWKAPKSMEWGMGC